MNCYTYVVETQLTKYLDDDVDEFQSDDVSFLQNDNQVLDMKVTYRIVNDYYFVPAIYHLLPSTDWSQVWDIIAKISMIDAKLGAFLCLNSGNRVRDGNSEVMKRVLNSKNVSLQIVESLIENGFELGTDVVVHKLQSKNIQEDVKICSILKSTINQEDMEVIMEQVLTFYFTNKESVSFKTVIFLIQDFQVNEETVSKAFYCNAKDLSDYSISRKYYLPMKTKYGLVNQGMCNELWTSMCDYYGNTHEFVVACLLDLILGGLTDAQKISIDKRFQRRVSSVSSFINSWKNKEQIPVLDVDVESSTEDEIDSMLSSGVPFTSDFVSPIAHIIIESRIPSLRFIFFMSRVESYLIENNYASVTHDWAESFKRHILESPNWNTLTDPEQEKSVDSPIKRKPSTSKYSSSSIFNTVAVSVRSLDSSNKDLRRFYYCCNELYNLIDPMKGNKMSRRSSISSVGSFSNVPDSLSITEKKAEDLEMEDISSFPEAKISAIPSLDQVNPITSAVDDLDKQTAVPEGETFPTSSSKENLDTHSANEKLEPVVGLKTIADSKVPQNTSERSNSPVNKHSADLQLDALGITTTSKSNDYQMKGAESVQPALMEKTVDIISAETDEQKVTTQDMKVRFNSEVVEYSDTNSFSEAEPSPEKSSPDLFPVYESPDSEKSLSPVLPIYESPDGENSPSPIDNIKVNDLAISSDSKDVGETAGENNAVVDDNLLSKPGDIKAPVDANGSQENVAAQSDISTSLDHVSTIVPQGKKESLSPKSTDLNGNHKIIEPDTTSTLVLMSDEQKGISEGVLELSDLDNHPESILATHQNEAMEEKLVETSDSSPTQLASPAVEMEPKSESEDNTQELSNEKQKDITADEKAVMAGANMEIPDALESSSTPVTDNAELDLQENVDKEKTNDIQIEIPSVGEVVSHPMAVTVIMSRYPFGKWLYELHNPPTPVETPSTPSNKSWGGWFS
ncbi:hypothetical protein HDV02_005195 [Globomyces sp. JEL0801]|nr:hypothetical protein HDV02_005195 [Globomyces sp. JEL0801]